ncbi:MAG: hypothetical protein ACFFG0_16120 [Candidatus Thorarchaeota archaeon]
MVFKKGEINFRIKFNRTFRESIIKKGFVKIFILSISLLIFGFVIGSLLTIIPKVSYTEPGYDEYLYLMRILSSASRLFVQIGIVMFSLALFMGALTDRTLSENVKRGLVVGAGIGMAALVLVMMYPYPYY